MKRILLITAVISLGLAIYTRTVARGQTAPEYEFTTVENVGTMDGTPVNTTLSSVRKTYFRRSDGISGMMIRETRKGNTATVIRYRKPKQNAEIVVQVDGKVASKYPVPQKTAEVWASHSMPTDCRGMFNGFQVVGEVELGGVRAQRLHLVNGTEDAEYYAAPSLDCAPLVEHHKWKNSQGAFVSWTNVELVEIKPGPPNPAWFDLDIGAREAAPSEARRIVRSLLYPGEPEPECWTKTGAKLDAVYTRRAIQNGANSAK